MRAGESFCVPFIHTVSAETTTHARPSLWDDELLSVEALASVQLSIQGRFRTKDQKDKGFAATPEDVYAGIHPLSSSRAGAAGS